MKLFLSLTISFFIFFPYFSFAQVASNSIVITEIMYDVSGTDTDHEWIEIKNVSTQTIDITGWKFNDGTNHVFNTPPANGSVGSMNIPPGGFAIIAANATQFIIDNNNFPGTVIDTVMSLSNTSDTIKIIDNNGAVINEVTYQSSVGANGDGNSLQFYQNSFVSGFPTLGSDYSLGTNPQPTGVSNTTPQQTIVVPKILQIPEQKQYALTANIELSSANIFTNVPFTIKPKVTGRSREKITTGRFLFNLGDGRVIEQRILQPIEIQYPHPGTYVIYFEYDHNSYFEDNPTDQLQITVLDSPLRIDYIDSDQTIHLANEGSTDLNISGFVLESGNKKFVFPNGTFIPQNKGITIDPSIHKLLEPSKGIIIYSPSNKKIVMYPEEESREKILSYVPLLTSPLPTYDFTSIKNTTTENISKKINGGIPAVPMSVALGPDSGMNIAKSNKSNPLLAQASVDNKEDRKISPWIISFLGLLFISIVGFFLLQKKENPETKEKSLKNENEVDQYSIIEEN